jgi:hypothetical protein
MVASAFGYFALQYGAEGAPVEQLGEPVVEGEAVAILELF